MKWNGWGYNDTKFCFDNNKVCEVTGNRYRISGHKLPLLRDWFTTLMNVGEDRLSLSQPEMTADKIPKPIINEAFMQRLRQTSIDTSEDPQDRLFRAHGHTMDELFMLRYGQYERIPDLVVWPSMNIFSYSICVAFILLLIIFVADSQEEVETLVKLANECNVSIIPYGGLSLGNIIK